MRKPTKRKRRKLWGNSADSVQSHCRVWGLITPADSRRLLGTTGERRESPDLFERWCEMAKGLPGKAKVIEERKLPNALDVLGVSSMAGIKEILELLAKREKLDMAQTQKALIHLLDTLWRLSKRFENWPHYQNPKKHAMFQAANAQREIDDIRLILRIVPWWELRVEIQTELNALNSVDFPPCNYGDPEEEFVTEVVEAFGKAIAVVGARVSRLHFKLDAYIEWRLAGGNPSCELFVSKMTPPARREAATHSLLVLEQTRQRHKQQEMVAVLKEQFSDAAGAVRDALSALKNAGFLTSKEDHYGKGYGLPEWDDELSG